MNQTITTQRTAKRYKAATAAGAAGVVFGIVSTGTPLALPLLALGLGAIAYGSIGAWWNHA